MSKIEQSKLNLMEIVRFDQDCFHTPSAEESIIACCGSRADFATAASFWLHSLFAADWTNRENYFTPYAESGLCLPIGTDMFHSIVKDCTYSLRRDLPAFLCDRQDLLCAQKMYDEWNDVAIIAERQHDFITFHWGTTA
jgi:hypothetical protein